MKKLIVAAILLSSSLMVYSQKNEKEVLSYKHSIGLGAGFTTGVGISYRFVPKKLGFQVNLGPMYSNYGKDIKVSLGLTLLDKFFEGKWCNLYFYVANNLRYTKNSDGQLFLGDMPNNGNSISNNTETYHLNSGLGMGWEFNTQKPVVFNFMMGYAQYNGFEKLRPTIEGAIYYRIGTKKS
ncbi:MAG: hypothetical protein HXX09_14490 [Bacteroidetes bacterium]|nr:hypothetical protein [Bacteroidota bacterium]